MKWEVLMKHQKCICNSQRVYPKPPNILHLLSIRVKCAGVWGKITPMKRGVLMKHQKSLPKTSKYFTPALVFGLNVQVSGVKMGCFHKVLPNVKSVYVTLQNFTPDLKKFYTDISAVSATLWNSGWVWHLQQYNVTKVETVEKYYSFLQSRLVSFDNSFNFSSNFFPFLRSATVSLTCSQRPMWWV